MILSSDQYSHEGFGDITPKWQLNSASDFKAYQSKRTIYQSTQHNDPTELHLQPNSASGLSTRQHSITIQQHYIFINTAVKSSNLTKYSHGLEWIQSSCMHQSNILTLPTHSWNLTILYNWYLHNNHQIFDKDSQYQSTASDQQGHVSWCPLDTVNHPFHTCQLGSQWWHGWKFRLFKNKWHSSNYN